MSDGPGWGAPSYRKGLALNGTSGDSRPFTSKVTLAQTGYGHFFVEHNRCHHVRVATPEDPASARLGESFWAFPARTVAGSLASAWQIEKARLGRQGRPTLSLGNDAVNAWALTAMLFGALLAAFGGATLPWLLVEAALGFCLLGRTAATSRALRDTRGTPTTWPRTYQALRSFPAAPELPSGYGTMTVVALVTPLWRRIMDPRVAAHYAGDLSLANMQPGKRRRYGLAEKRG